MTTSYVYSVCTLVYMYAPVIAVVTGRKGLSNAVRFPPVSACCIHCDTGTATAIRTAYLTPGTVRVSRTALNTDTNLVS